MVFGGYEMTREQSKKSLVNLVKDVLQQNKKRIEIDLKLIDEIYDDFDHIAEILIKANEEEISRHFNEVERLTKQHEEELKKAYIEGGNDAWKTLNWADNALKYWESYDGKVRK